MMILKPAASIFLLFLCSSLIAQPPVKVSPLTEDVFVHTTYQLWNNEPFPSNGLIINTSAGIVLVDTGWGVEATEQLLDWIHKNLHKPVILCIVSHYHEDRLGGVGVLKKENIRSISTKKTALKAESMKYVLPEGILPEDTTFTIGNTTIQTFYPGKGHTEDNIVVYIPEHGILFGGCLVKSVEAFGLGNIADAFLADWKKTIENVHTRFPDSKVIVPGHQQWSDQKALTHTVKLLDEKGNAPR